MKKIHHTMKAVVIAAFLFACGSPTGPEKSNADTSATDEHAHHGGAPVSGNDTTVIKDGQEVFFANLKDGQTVPAKFKVEFGVKGMEPENIEKGINPNKGHHHLMIDTLQWFPAGQLIPKAEGRILHFGKGQTSTELELKPGKHKLSLQFANGSHLSYGIRMSKTIEITVNSGLTW